MDMTDVERHLWQVDFESAKGEAGDVVDVASNRPGGGFRFQPHQLLKPSMLEILSVTVNGKEQDRSSYGLTKRLGEENALDVVDFSRMDAVEPGERVVLRVKFLKTDTFYVTMFGELRGP